MESPKIDERTFEDLLRQITERAGAFAPEWSSRARDDAGMVLAAIYAHYLEILLERLNRVPEKNLLAFLDLMGVGLLPPGAAQAPVVFTLAPNAGDVGFVPKGTQIATAQTETQPAVLFETQQNLNVVLAQLVSAYTIEPQPDRTGNRTLVVTGLEGTIFSPFQGDRLIDHILYVDGDPLFLMQRAGRLILTFRLPSTPTGLEDFLSRIAWESFRAGDWQPIPPPTFALNDNQLTLTFPNFAGADMTAISGPGLSAPPSRWVRGRAHQPMTLNVDAVAARVEQTIGTAQIRPPLTEAHADGTPVSKMNVSPPVTSLARPPANSAGAPDVRVEDRLALSQTSRYLIVDSVQSEVVQVSIPETDGEGDVNLIPPTTLHFSHAPDRVLRRMMVAPGGTTVLAAEVAQGSQSIRLATLAGLSPGDWVRVQGNQGVEDAQADVVRLVGPFPNNPPFNVNIAPALQFPHALGRVVRQGPFLTVGAAKGASVIRLTDATGLDPGDWVMIQGNVGAENAQAEFVQVAGPIPKAPPFNVKIKPALRFAHTRGREVRPATLSGIATRLVAPTHIELAESEGLAEGNLMMLDDDVRTEFVQLGAIPPDPPFDVPVTPRLRFHHAADVLARRITAPSAVTTLATNAAADSDVLTLVSATDLGVNDVVRVGDTDHAQITAMGTGIPPDHVHVNTAPVDFSKEFLPLGDNPKAGDALYIASTEALSKVEPTLSPAERGKVTLHVDVNVGDARLKWEYLDFTLIEIAAAWKPLQVDDRTSGFTRNGTISFTLPADAEQTSIPMGQQTVRVFAVRVTVESGSYKTVPCLQSLRLTTGFSEGHQLLAPPAVAFTSETPLDMLILQQANFSGVTPLDLLHPFHPFGLNPAAGNTFTLGLLPQQQATIGQPVQMEVTLVPQTAQLVWEYLDAQGWKSLGTASAQQPTPLAPQGEFQFVDTTNAFTQSGIVSFRRPLGLASGEVNGQPSNWIRARFAAGYYGRPLDFVPINAADPSKGFKPRPGTGALNPPVINAIRLNYTAQNPSPKVLAQNQFFLEDQTAKNAPDDDLFYAAFEPVVEDVPTFYLGFDRKLPNNSVHLYFVVPPRQFVEKIDTVGNGRRAVPTEPQLVWQYWNGREWTKLDVADETRNFTESGGVQFLGPTDMTSLVKFEDTPRFWIRVRLERGGRDYAPLLSGVFLNAVRVAQATTVENELLGSSNGRKHQVFRPSKTPVLTGQQILVREPERPPAEEAAEIVKEDADGVWVRWQEVSTLKRSSERSRHYTIDHTSGEVRFGDGTHGLIPPEGRDNIVCESYRAGGGSAGNQATGALSQLKTSIPYVAAVTNPIPADGGSDAETLLAVQERGPQTLKHRSRAVTAEDFEWLARQAAGTRVARAKCLSNRNRDLEFEPGWATVIIVPVGNGHRAVPEKKLLPSAELIREVEDDFTTRSLATLTSLTPAHVNVIGPGYVPVEVAVKVKPVDLTQADAVRKAVLDALDKFLHPLTGGPDGQGWAFGRDVFLSELYAAFEDLKGVEHVHSLRFKPTVATLPLKFTQAVMASHPQGAAVTVTVGGNSLRARLVEALPVGAAEAMVTLFREGERVTLTPAGEGESPAEPIVVTVRDISGNTLTVDPFRARVKFPKGTVVASVDGASASFLTADVEKDALVSLLAVQGFEAGQSVNVAGESLPLQEMDGQLDLGMRLRVPEFYLVYSGTQTVEISQD